MYENIAKNIKNLRKSLGKTRQEFAEELGYVNAYIGQLERAERRPSYNFMKAFNERFPEISMNEFFFGGDKDA